MVSILAAGLVGAFVGGLIGGDDDKNTNTETVTNETINKFSSDEIESINNQCDVSGTSQTDYINIKHCDIKDIGQSNYFKQICQMTAALKSDSFAKTEAKYKADLLGAYINKTTGSSLLQTSTDNDNKITITNTNHTTSNITKSLSSIQDCLTTNFKQSNIFECSDGSSASNIRQINDANLKCIMGAKVWSKAGVKTVVDSDTKAKQTAENIGGKKGGKGGNPGSGSGNTPMIIAAGVGISSSSCCFALLCLVIIVIIFMSMNSGSSSSSIPSNI